MTEQNGVGRSSATEELRRLLDERGVKWRETALGETRWLSTVLNGNVSAKRINDKLVLFTGYKLITPEQAVAATLGREPDDAAMVKLHDQMNAALFEYERAQGIEKRDGDEAIVVPWVVKMHALLEEAATLGSCNCSNSERTRACLPHFWTHDGTLHIEATRMPTRIVVCEGGTCEFVPKRELDASEAENAKLRDGLADAPKCETCEAMLDCDECLRADGSHKERRRLSAENAKLREERDNYKALWEHATVTDCELRRVRAAWKEDREQNAKLRELCKAWREFAYEIFDECFGEPELNDEFMALDDRMRESGMEVD